MIFQKIRQLLSRPHLAIICTLVVCILLFSPSVELPGYFLVPINDKLVHGIMFTGLSLLWQMYFQENKKTLFFLIAFAISSEIVQYLLPLSFNRSFELLDIFADTIGIILGIYIAFLFNKRGA